MAFATMLFSVAAISQNLSEHVILKTLPDGITEITYDNKPGKYFIHPSKDGINYKITTEGSNKIIYGSMVTDSSGNMNVVVGNIKYTVNASGQVGNLSVINSYGSVNAPPVNLCVMRAIEECQNQFWCSIVCQYGYSFACVASWTLACAVGTLE